MTAITFSLQDFLRFIFTFTRPCNGTHHISITNNLTLQSKMPLSGLGLSLLEARHTDTDTPGSTLMLLSLKLAESRSALMTSLRDILQEI